MSLINDALKRAEHGKSSNGASIPTAVAASKTSRKNKPVKIRRTYATPILIAMISAVGATGMTLHLAGGHNLPGPDIAHAQMAPPVIPPAANPVIEKESPKETITDGTNDKAVTAQPVQSEIDLKAKPDPITPEPKPETKITPAPLPLPTKPELTLNGIVFHYDVTKAVINGNTYGLNDEIDGAKIIKIESSKVILLFKGKKITLNL